MFNLQTILPQQLEVTTQDLSVVELQLYQNLIRAFIDYNQVLGVSVQEFLDKSGHAITTITKTLDKTTSSSVAVSIDNMSNNSNTTSSHDTLKSATTTAPTKVIDDSKLELMATNRLLAKTVLEKDKLNQASPQLGDINPQIGVIFGEGLTITQLALALAYLGLDTQVCPVSEVKTIAGITYIVCLFTDFKQAESLIKTLVEPISKEDYINVLADQVLARTISNSERSELPISNLPLQLLKELEYQGKTNINSNSNSNIQENNSLPLFPTELRGFDVGRMEDIPNIEQVGFYCSDMDMTAVQAECIDEIAALAGVGEQVAAITHKAMEGHLDFAESLRARVATLAGHDVNIIDQVKAKIQAMGGLDYLCAYLNQHHWISAIVSGGFNDFTSALTETAQITYYYSNELEQVDGKFTGKVLGEIVGAEQKANFLVATATKHQIAPNQIIAIGDGANDLCMMKQAGCSIAYHAKPKVQDQAKINLRFTDLRGVIVLLEAKKLLNQIMV